MPKIAKFNATRYGPGMDLDLVSSPPYDVISPTERDRLDQLHSNNFIHVSLGAQSPGDTDADNRYTRAAGTWREWLTSGVLVTDDREHLYLYRSDFEVNGHRRATAGVLAALRLEALGTGGVYGHERTTPGPKADRLALMRTTAANLEPLWFFSSAPLEGFAAVVDALQDEQPLADVTDADGVRHRMWRLSDDQAGELIDRVAATPLVVADGHHRYETALTYREERRAIDGPGPWDYTLALISDPAQFAPELLPIHRLATGVSVDGLDMKPFEGGLYALHDHVRRAGPGTLGVAGASSCWTIQSTGEIDTVWLAENVLEPSEASVAYEHDLDEVAAAIQAGNTVAFLMPSTPVELVAAKALEGVRMPPKTTLFWPKPRSGLIMRNLTP
ncbi:MAG: DUF1015 domain-containing protein [Actinomycetota bacterium]